MTRKTDSLEVEDLSSKYICQQNALLMIAIDSGNISEAEKLLKESGESNTAIVNAPCGRLRVTALQLAATKSKNGVKLVNLLLKNGASADVSDKLGRTALHAAALQGNDEIVKALLEAGAKVDSYFQVNSWPKQQLNSTSSLDSDYKSLNCNENTPRFKMPLPECFGRTPLHQAVKSGNPACVRQLIEAGAKVNAEDEKGVTPLLLAGAGVGPDNRIITNKYEEIVEMLVKAGANVNLKNEDTGMTAVCHAVAARSIKAIKCLLDAGAKIDAMENEGSTTVLHVAAQTGCVTIVELLLERGARCLVNVGDKFGCTPLHKAAYVGARDCLRTLLKHGGDLSAETNTNASVTDAIFSHIPRPVNFVTDVLNESIQPNNASVNDRNFKVTLDFSLLCPHGLEQQMAVVTALMSGASDLQQMRILQHPLLEAFLRFKWHRLRIIFAMLAVVHACFVASLSVYCMLLVYNNNHYTNTEIVVSRRILLVSVLVLFVHSVAQIMLLPRHYIAQYETWVNFLCIVLSLIIAVSGETGTEMTPFLNDKKEPTKSTWVLHVMSFAVLLAWIELMLLIGRFPTVGYYALMFYQVLRNVIKVLLTFGGLVMGFVISFSVQFHEMDQFKDIWKGLVKTIVMMMGEYEYSELFPDNQSQLRLHGTSRIIFLGFVILSSIVLMNLMVGLAVNDIQELQTEGHVQRLLKQAEFLEHCEKVSSHNKLKSALFPVWLYKILDKRQSIETTYTFQPSEVVANSNNLSYPLLESIVGVAMYNQAKSAGHPVRYSDDFQSCRNAEGQKRYTRGEYGSQSEPEIMTPVSSTSHTSIIVMLHELQQEIAGIRQALQLDLSDESEATVELAADNHRSRNFSMRANRWTRPVAEVQEAQGILRRMRRNSSNLRNVVV
ncbi:transient receptor potential channel pyrexia-like [Periplaneta americana]|uniref:transient receptor potential channel pyrexia-like n=1 Tax=Periplaneta americana TaxID=6978 RepID=UPI0037E8661F